MLFNSLIFLVFAGIFFVLWPLFRKYDLPRWLYISAASFVFYGWWDWRFLFLLAGCGLFNFLLGDLIYRKTLPRKLLLGVVIAGNLGTLGIFKYAGFATANFNSALNLAGMDYTLPSFNIVLPVGISFFTFQAMSYAIDIYRGTLQPTKNFFHFLAFLSMFPQLVAGPIVRAADLLPQLAKPGRASREDQWEGAKEIIAGYLKKILIADQMAVVVNGAFASSGEYHSMPFWWMVMICFAIQIYGDFSGYSSIACGLARWMGYRFEDNFNHPYCSGGVREFWSKWHISLSSWFRDYVYFPLGGSRVGKVRTICNLWCTMLLSGLWHGANWTFLFWGGLHAFYLTIEHFWNWPKWLEKKKYGRWIAVPVCFLLTVLAWVFFRAANFSEALEVAGKMFSFNFHAAEEFDRIFNDACWNVLIFAISLELAILFKLPDFLRTHVKFCRTEAAECALYTGLLILTVAFRAESAGFLYFQF